MFHEQHISSGLAFESDRFVTLNNDTFKSEANTKLSRSGQGNLYNYYIDGENPVCVHSPTFLS